MQKVIRNNWQEHSGGSFSAARILHKEIHPEGMDVSRIRFDKTGSLFPDANVGHIISVHSGKGNLHVADGKNVRCRIGTGVHLYLPPGTQAVFDAEPGTELVHVATASAAQARGKKILLRDETFVAACASGKQSLRWAFTSQYLSRRIFLHHDQTLLSKSGEPVSWFRTTMFDVSGLPGNEDGEPVFKMSYNSRTEFNVCYDVQGAARVRMALHPYQVKKQSWSPWLPLDSDSTYHLNEAAGSPEEECCSDEVNRTTRLFRNKHEVHILDGHVTLFCMFDPAPTGIENHRPGEYSDYEPLSQVVGTSSYKNHQQEMAKYDEMVDKLSLARATDTLHLHHGTPAWVLYLNGRETQRRIEEAVALRLAAAGKGRDQVLACWMQTGPDI